MARQRAIPGLTPEKRAAARLDIQVEMISGVPDPDAMVFGVGKGRPRRQPIGDNYSPVRRIDMSKYTVELPPEFIENPERFCGRKKGDGGPCMRIAGMGTDHPGVGCCRFHSTGRPIIGANGGKSMIAHSGPSLIKRMQQLKQDSTLYDLDNAIAYLQVLFERQIGANSEAFERYDLLKASLESGEMGDDGELEKDLRAVLPEIDLTIIEQLGKTIRTAYEMKFSRRFSITIPEMEHILGQIANSFNRLMDKYGVDPEAKREFAHAMLSLRTNKPIDPRLDWAGRDQRERAEILPAKYAKEVN